MPSENIHPVSSRLIPKTEKEKKLGAKGKVFWLCGLSGSGKSTLAISLERGLMENGISSIVLDGDNLRSTINKDLGFSDEDREENLRRVSELAKLIIENGLVAIVSFITPQEKFRTQAKEIIGTKNYFEVFVDAPFDTCAKRDVKGLYKKASNGGIASFTGHQSTFEPPVSPWLKINTDKNSLDESSSTLLDAVSAEVRL